MQISTVWKGSLPDVVDAMRDGHFKTSDKGVAESRFFTQFVKKYFQ